MGEMLGLVIGRLWSMSMQASVLICAVLLVRLFLRNYKKMYSYLLWLLVLIRLLCPVMIESKWSMQPDFVSEDFAQVSEIPDYMDGNDTDEISNVSNTNIYTDNINSSADSNVGNIGSEFADNAGNSGIFVSYPQVAYFIGLIGVTGYFMIQYLRMRKRVALAVCEKENIWLCEQIVSPFVMGIVKPKIYLPYTISSEEKKYILRHEHAHIAHHDPVVRLLGTCALILHWWNPLVWYAMHKMNQDMEMFCDETALEKALLTERKEYSKTLLRFAAKQSGLAVVLSFGMSNTEIRIKNVFRKKKNSILIGVAVVLIGILCAVVFLTSPEESGHNVNDTEQEPSSGIALLLDDITLRHRNEPWCEAYLTILDDWTIIEEIGDFSYLKEQFEDDYSFDGYWLCDVDNNGVPELFLHSNDMNITAVFTYYDNQIIHLISDVFYGVNKDTAELVVKGNWNAGGSGENEWTAYKITKNEAVQSLYIDYNDTEGLEEPYTIYTLDNQEYEKQENAEEYNELYEIHVEPCKLIGMYRVFWFFELGGLNAIH